MVDILKAASELSDYASVRDFLYGLRYHGAKYGLDRVMRFAGIMNHPERDLRCIHVAGTNGKGSTCAILEQIFRDQGYRTGLYSSPHLIRQGERIQVNREVLHESEIVRLTKYMVGKLLQMKSTGADDWPSFFEFMTVMAWYYFREQQVDIAMIETGLGGRLDATNILQPVISVITSISLDHTNILGDTIEQIAAEKAGIIKEGVPVVIGRLVPGAEAVIRSVAESKNAHVYSVAERWGYDLGKYPDCNLSGDYQRINAATAILVCEVLDQLKPDFLSAFSIHDVKASLCKVDWPGRWETVVLEGAGCRELILDATHNEEGAAMLEKNLERLLEDRKCKPVIAAGSLGEDRARSLLRVVCDFTDTLYLLQPNQPRALTQSQLRSCIPESFKGEIIEAKVEDLFSYKNTSVRLDPDQVFLVTGSIYLIGEVSDRLKSLPVADQQSLQDVV